MITKQNTKPVRVEANIPMDEVMVSFYRVRSAILDLFAAVGADPNRTRESSRLMGLSRQLTWRLSRIVCANEPEVVLSDMPGPQGMRKFITACRERGATPESLDAVAEAADRFERAISALSGDRKSLSAIMASQGEGPVAGALERERRKLFEGGCAVWGVQAQVRFVSIFLFPAPDDPTMIDVGHVTGYVGFRRLRPIPWPLSYEVMHSLEGRPMKLNKRPLAPHGTEEGTRQLLHAFCDPPDPQIQVTMTGDLKKFELAAGPVGNAGAATVVFGSYLPHLYPQRRTPEDLDAAFNVLLETPVERLIFDVFVHQDLESKEPVYAHLCEKLIHPNPPTVQDYKGRSLPLNEKPFALGPSAVGAMTPHMPWYSRLVTFVSDRIGHPPSEFSGTRFEMTYPPIPTALARGLPLAPPL